VSVVTARRACRPAGRRVNVAPLRDPARGIRFDEPAGRWVLVATVLGSGLAMLDATVVNVALARIGTDLGGDVADLQWTIGAYALTLASFVLLGGSLGDRLGRRRVFVVGTAWFAIASALCALAPTIGALVAARALQGVGGALLTPGSLAIISASFTAKDRPRAIGAWSGFGGIAGAIGPFVGGWLVGTWSWRLVFLVNVPLAAIVIAVALRHVPESRDPSAGSGLDAAGTFLGALGLAALTWAAIAGGKHGLGATVVATAAIGALALVGFALVERRSRDPLVPPEMFASRRFTVANVYTFAVYAALGSVFFFLALDLQVVAGYTPLAAGASMLPVTAAMLALSPRSGALAQRLGPRPQLVAGPPVAAAGLLLTLRIGPGAPYLPVVFPAVTLFGLGLAALVAPLTATVLAAAPAGPPGGAAARNNARAAGLLAVAVLPAIAGLSGGDYRNADGFAAGYRIATVGNAALLALGSVLAALGLDGAGARRAYRHCFGCPVDGPRPETLQPGRPAA
jgi:EmrB/QacA subfamily drug resistance transporter